MSERQPRRRPVELNFGERSFLCEWHNTTIFVHGEDDKKYDHIFLIESPDPDEEDEGRLFFRETFDKFDDLLKIFRKEGYSFIEKETVTDGDRAIYNSHFGEPEAPAVLESSKLSPRQDRHVAYLAYLLDKEHLTPNDFGIEGGSLL